MSHFHPNRSWLYYGASCLALGLAVCAAPAFMAGAGAFQPSSPRILPNATLRQAGDAAAGRNVFRFETFGNEGFWTDAARLPQGMMQKKITPLQALKAGAQVDADAVPQDMRQEMDKEFKTDLSAASAPLLNDPQTTVKLVNANAVIGVVVKDTNGDGTLDIRRGDKVGITCAFCHTVTDGSVYAMPRGGSVGRRLDGLTPHFLNIGKLLAAAANSRAFYPILQLDMGGKSIGRASKGLKPNATEREVDAYLSNPKYFPVGAFDDTPDGNGNPIQIMPLFRQDLSAPYGTSGQVAALDDFSTLAYTVLLDPTSLVTPEGRKFLKIEAGAAGEKLAHNYARILKETRVKGYPFVHAQTGFPVDLEKSPVGRHVDAQKIMDLHAYLVSLPPPAGIHPNPAAEARGRELFRRNCTRCHNLDQSRPVSPRLIPMKVIWPGYRPTIIARRKPPLSPVQNSPGTFDDKMIVVDASFRGEIRGNALPLLLGLARKPRFLHDSSVPGLDALLNPARGKTAPHPFYLRQPSQRADMVAFLKGLEIKRR